MAVVRRMAITFGKADWGSGRETWREMQQSNRSLWKRPCRFVLRRISNRRAKARELYGQLCMYGERPFAGLR